MWPAARRKKPPGIRGQRCTSPCCSSSCESSKESCCALLGVIVPFALDRLGRDPALGSSVLLTFSTDGLGFMIFLGLATMLF